ncbi:MAG: ComF family protein [Firmicutes bacterium]|nr:ComF family protein [Bacillota bacterium]
MYLSYLLQGLWELMYPPRRACPLCGSQTSKGEICPHCLQWVRRHGSGPVCPVCGRFINLPSVGPCNHGRHPCPICASQAPAFNAARAVGPYEGVLRDAILHLKSKGTRRVAAALGELAAEVVHREPAFAAAELIIPVPLAPRRLARRGFNQAQLLALELGNLIELPVDTKAVAKVRETKPQIGLSRYERERNLIDAFAVITPETVYGKRILLIDDVLTTGATMDNISIKLRRHQPSTILALTAAGGKAGVSFV